MKDEQSGQNMRPSDGKRHLEENDVSDEPTRKVPKTTVKPSTWFHSSFNTSKPTVPTNPSIVQHAPRSAQWISPAFSRATTQAGGSFPSISRGMPVPSVVHADGSSTPVHRSLHNASQMSRNLALPPSTPTRGPATRRPGPPAFSVPGKQTKPEERIHHALSHVKPPRPPPTSTPSQSPVTAKFRVAGSQQKPPLRPRFDLTGISSDGSEEYTVDERDRGLFISPQKSRARNKGGLADRAEMIIARQATSNKLWSISEEAAALVPDFKVQITTILSLLPGRILTRCRMLTSGMAFDGSGLLEGIVLFGAENKELKEGMSIGIWKPWGELPMKPLEPSVSTLETAVAPIPDPPAEDVLFQAEQPNEVLVEEDSHMSKVDDDDIRDSADPVSSINEQQPTTIPDPHVLLVTRYRILN
ncbi:hypothetical protein DACRYDRAFT_108582 [Dacryopinax primogenitus]|uniref:Uncharacterized protein n=1 Tax=Dacryopinax primogenitus (strain DJM 731) TaxID=1858805 RepID=M5FSQ2_DACPD|nr:uncharacterized protein DACRYDRAFT_108582 [Dacryopinax primogenitus]EJU00516.1 hypothetical protein DACRYDRAFT_108582 [Dacryopinax primogenitus]